MLSSYLVISNTTSQYMSSKTFSTISSPNKVLTPLKRASKTHSERLVRPFQIFVWGGGGMHSNAALDRCMKAAAFKARRFSRHNELHAHGKARLATIACPPSLTWLECSYDREPTHARLTRTSVARALKLRNLCSPHGPHAENLTINRKCS